MHKYRIAWLPGDGIGPEVCAAARTVLDAVEFPAEYIHGDIGWEFWKSEGEALPDRTVELLSFTNCALFGAITSKPSGAAARELAPALAERHLTYRSPIVRMRQMLDLYTCLRPCKSFPRNPLNYREDIDLVVFRENTEGMYIGVEFPRTPAAFYSEPLMERVPREAAISIRSITPEGSRRIVRAAFEYAVKHGAAKGHRRAQGQRAAGHLRRVPRSGAGGGGGLPGDRVRYRQRGRHVHVAAQEPRQLRRHRHHQPLRRHPLRPVRAARGRHGLRLQRQHRGQLRGVRAHARLGAEVRRAEQGEPAGDDPGGGHDARVARRRRRSPRASRRRSRRWWRAATCAPTTWAAGRQPRRWPAPWWKRSRPRPRRGPGARGRGPGNSWRFAPGLKDSPQRPICSTDL